MLKDEGSKLALILNYYNYEIESDNFKIVCPFHKDVNPSLIINLEEGKWYCFGCGRSGNALDFVRFMEKKYHNKNDLYAVQLYQKIISNEAIKSNIIKIINVSTKVKKDKVESLEEAKNYYYCLPQIKWEDYRLDEEKKNARQYLVNRGFTTDTLNNIGCKYNYNKNYELILPMLDNGTFKGWVCRTTNKEIEKKRKYLYNKGFSRTNTLVGDYGLNQTKKDYVFVVEGFMDRLKLYQYGFINSVAILGWKISGNQIQKLKDSGVKKIISCLDNDTAGKNGHKYIKNFFETYRIAFPKGLKDIGDTNKKIFYEMLKKTKEKYSLKVTNKTIIKNK